MVIFRDAGSDDPIYKESPQRHYPHWLRPLMQPKPASPSKKAGPATKATRLGDTKRRPKPE
jgi:hypothetical protein